MSEQYPAKSALIRISGGIVALIILIFIWILAVESLQKPTLEERLDVMNEPTIEEPYEYEWDGALPGEAPGEAP
mgnify:CR=1 FL=1